MYVLIDRDRLVFCHAHPEHAVVSNLATIELGHSKASILNTTVPQCFHDFTMLELKLLYQNTTGHKFEGFSHFHLEEMCLATARALPVSDVNPFEAGRQALACATDADNHYKYVKGAYSPARQLGIFEPAALAATPGTMPAPGPQTPRASTVAAPQAVAAPSEAPRKGARAVIFSVADTMWSDAGNPNQLPKILALRKAVMQELETKHGIKKTTSSTALGEWQKLRCPV